MNSPVSFWAFAVAVNIGVAPWFRYLLLSRIAPKGKWNTSQEQLKTAD
jgi:hypothetical protein